MSIEGNFEEVAKWLARLREALTRYDRHLQTSLQLGLPEPRIRIARRFHDFAQIEELTPATALLIASEYDRLQTKFGIKLGVYNLRQWRSPVKRLLYDIGFFDLLGIQPARPQTKSNSGFVRMARHESGDNLEPERVAGFVAQVSETLLQLDAAALADPARRGQTLRLVGALIEATENTRQHAYPEEMRREGAVPKWWMAGAAYPEEKRFTLIVYDQGISIPGSLEEGRNSSWEGHAWVNSVIKRFLRRRPGAENVASDQVKIRLAMNYGTTSTGKGHRGKGLPRLKDAVDNCRNGNLLVMSRSGEYFYRKGRRATTRVLPVELPGTLIVWDFWL